MKIKYYISITLLLAISSFVRAQDSSVRMKEAADLYQKGDYFNAAAIYKELYDDGYRSSDLMYNAGNAWFKAKDFGYSVLFYERASLYNPASEDVNYNLQIARSNIKDKFDEIPEVFLVRWFDFLALLNGTNHWAYLALGLFILAMILILFFFFTSIQRLRHTAFWLAVLSLFISVLSVLFAIRSNKLVNHNENAIVICSEVVGKSSPGADGKDLFVIHSGTKVLILQEVGNYSEIRLPDGNKGWTKSDCIENI